MDGLEGCRRAFVGSIMATNLACCETRRTLCNNDGLQLQLVAAQQQHGMMAR